MFHWVIAIVQVDCAFGWGSSSGNCWQQHCGLLIFPFSWAVVLSVNFHPVVLWAHNIVTFFSCKSCWEFWINADKLSQSDSWHMKAAIQLRLICHHLSFSFSSRLKNGAYLFQITYRKWIIFILIASTAAPCIFSRCRAFEFLFSHWPSICID